MQPSPTSSRSRDELILSLEPLVMTAARVHKAKWPWLDWTDAVSDAWLGAILAVDGYDETKGASLTTYAYTRINGEVVDGVRDRHHTRRQVHQFPTSLDLVLEDRGDHFEPMPVWDAHMEPPERVRKSDTHGTEACYIQSRCRCELCITARYEARVRRGDTSGKRGRAPRRSSPPVSA